MSISRRELFFLLLWSNTTTTNTATATATC